MVIEAQAEQRVGESLVREAADAGQALLTSLNGLSGQIMGLPEVRGAVPLPRG